MLYQKLLCLTSHNLFTVHAMYNVFSDSKKIGNFSDIFRSFCIQYSITAKIPLRFGKGFDFMKRNCKMLGICVMAVGVLIFLACFLPPMVMVCVEAVLLVVLGYLYFTL